MVTLPPLLVSADFGACSYLFIIIIIIIVVVVVVVVVRFGVSHGLDLGPLVSSLLLRMLYVCEVTKLPNVFSALKVYKKFVSPNTQLIVIF
jgi:hypothetical protein